MSGHVWLRNHGTQRRVAAAVMLVGVLMVMGFAQAGTVLAAPPEPGNASCMGYEASNVSPPGTSAEAPGGMPNVLADLDAFFAGTGAFDNRGAVISFFTRLGAGSHEACDEALVEAVFGG